MMMTPSSLAELEDMVRRDLDLLRYPSRPWLTPRETSTGKYILDVLIVGGGQSGLAVAFGLLREKVDNILVLDSQDAGREGPWSNFARMRTLRTPTYLTGPDGGIPSLTVRAWYEAQHGANSWESLRFLPKNLWMEYLVWFRETLALPVENNSHAGALQWDEKENCWRVPITSTITKSTRTETLYARKIVLATGIEGSGYWQTPAHVADAVPQRLRAHTHQDIDFDALRGARVGILGAGACAFDNAAVALETGAASVDQFFRRKEMVRVNPYRWAEFVGFLKHHADLPDADRWRFIRQIVHRGQLPPADTYRRATQLPGHRLHPGSPWHNVETIGETVQVTTPAGTFDFDFVIAGTGFVTDLARRPELANLHPHIALWRDRYAPPPGEESEDLARHPYLGANFELQEKSPGSAPHLSSVFNYTFGCLPSMGFGGASISGMKYSLPRVVAGITRQLYAEGAAGYFADLCAYDVEEF